MSGFGCFVFFVATLTTTVYSAALPPDIDRCALKDKDFFPCLRAAMEKSLTTLKNGNRAIGLLPIEPLHIDSYTIDQGGSSTVKIKLEMKDVDMYGLSASKIIEIKGDASKFDFYVESFTPEMKMQANYEITGQVLLLPVTGSGPSELIFKNTKAIHHMKGELYEKKGKQYMRFAYDVTFEPTNIVYRFDNLFGGNKELSDNMNRVFNDNSLEIYQEIKESVQQTFSIVFKGVMNGLFEKLPYNEIFIV